MKKKLSGIELITKERDRQINKLGWTSEHDDGREKGELASMAVCYASPVQPFILDKGRYEYRFVDAFPATWDLKWDKRKYFSAGYGDLEQNADLPLDERIHNLVKAGALIAAEIDRLGRIK